MKNTRERVFAIESIVYNSVIKLGTCECKKDVYENQLYVEQGKEVYHFACFNDLQKESE